MAQGPAQIQQTFHLLGLSQRDTQQPQCLSVGVYCSYDAFPLPWLVNASLLGEVVPDPSTHRPLTTSADSLRHQNLRVL